MKDEFLGLSDSSHLHDDPALEYNQGHIFPNMSVHDFNRSVSLKLISKRFAIYDYLSFLCTHGKYCTGYTWVTNKQIAEKFDCTERYVSDAINFLESNSYIFRVCTMLTHGSGRRIYLRPKSDAETRAIIGDMVMNDFAGPIEARWDFNHYKDDINKKRKKQLKRVDRNDRFDLGI